jgi:hypothetical protein
MSKSEKTILSNTDMIFLLSDFLDDQTAMRLFNAQRSYANMLQNQPERYRYKEKILKKLQQELRRYGSETYWSDIDPIKKTLTIRIGYPWKVCLRDGKLKISFEDTLGWYGSNPPQPTFIQDKKLINALYHYLKSIF